jgi:hypothetical protein
MKFAIKLCHDDEGEQINPHWDHYDDPRVKDQRDAFAYGKVMAEYWNNDLRPGDLPMKVLNAQVIGPGSTKKRLPPPDPRQMDMLAKTSRRMQ